MEDQRAIDNGAIRGPGLVDVVELASSIAVYAARVTASATGSYVALSRQCPDPQRLRVHHLYHHASGIARRLILGLCICSCCCGAARARARLLTPLFHWKISDYSYDSYIELVAPDGNGGATRFISLFPNICHHSGESLRVTK